MIVIRLLTNRHVRSHRAAIADAGTAVGAIPPLFSALYLIGLAGLTVSAIWAFVAVAWWGTLVVIAFYLLTGLVQSYRHAHDGHALDLILVRWWSAQ